MSAKKIAIIIDPIEKININKDTTYALMVEAHRQGHELFYVQSTGLMLSSNKATIIAQPLIINENENDWFCLAEAQQYDASYFDLLFMRKDPPFDQNYLYATYLLELFEKAGVNVINNPRSLRDCNEKLFATWFPQCCPPFLVTSDKQALKTFLQQHHDIILKPLHGMAGQGIFRVQENDPNINVIIETISNNGTTLVMAQLFIEDIVKTGDKRILMINGEAYSHALARMPAKGETRANLATGGKGKAVPLTERDQWICQQVGSTLKDKGLLLVGVDIIGDYLTEINVTSPTGLRELADQTKTNIAAQVWQAFLN